MRKTFVLIISVFALFLSASATRRNSGEKAVLRVIENQIGTAKGIKVKLSGAAEDGLDSYKLTAARGKVLIEATTPTAACYGFNEYLQHGTGVLGKFLEAGFTGFQIEQRLFLFDHIAFFDQPVGKKCALFGDAHLGHQNEVCHFFTP